VSDERLNHKELTEKLRVRPCTVRFWTRLGMPYEPAGRLRFYNLADVKAWLRERDEARRAARRGQPAAA